jgi:hypothetical protein
MIVREIQMNSGKSPMDRRRVDLPEVRPEKTIGGLRIQAVVEEVNSTINARAEKRIAFAERRARMIERLATHAEAIMQLNATPAENLAGPRAARVLREFKVLVEAIARFEPLFADFVREHAAVVAPAAIDQVKVFVGWVPKRHEQLRAQVRRFRERYERDLEESKDELDNVTKTWSVVDGDGLR